MPRNQWLFEGPEGIEAVEVHGPLTVTMGHALRMAALAGLGIILQQRILLQMMSIKGCCAADAAMAPCHAPHAYPHRPPNGRKPSN